MIRLFFIASAMALFAPAKAEPVIEPLVVADKACAAFKDPVIPQTYKDQMRRNIYISMAGPIPAGANEGFKAIWEGYAIVRQRGCGQ